MPTQVRIADPSFINKGLTFREMRVNQTGILTGAANGLARSGLFATGAHPVGPTSPASLRSRVEQCQFAVGRAGQGVWVAGMEAAVEVDHAASNSSNPRIDLVVGRVYSTEAGDTVPSGLSPTPAAGQTGVAVVEVITGTAASSPVEPSVPAGAVKLRAVRVNAGVTTLPSSAYQTHGPYTAARGGVLPINDLAERNALPTDARLVIDRRDLGRIERYEPGDARWHLVAPAVLPTIVESTWTNAAAQVISGWDAEQKVELARLTIASQQVPVRPSVVFACEIGVEGATSAAQEATHGDSRVDLFVRVVGATTYELDRNPASGPRIQYQRLITGISDRAEPGSFTVIIYAYRPYGTRNGYVNAPNRKFHISLHAD